MAATYALVPLYVNSGSTWQNIPGVYDVGGPEWSKTDIKVTDMNSTAQEFIASPLGDPGKLSFSVYFDPSNPIHRYLVQKTATTGSADTWQMRFPNGVVYAFTGSAMDLKVKASNPESNVLEADCTIKLSGMVSGSF